jgi:hypothetical protein
MTRPGLEEIWQDGEGAYTHQGSAGCPVGQSHSNPKFRFYPIWLFIHTIEERQGMMFSLPEETQYPKVLSIRTSH